MCIQSFNHFQQMVYLAITSFHQTCFRQSSVFRTQMATNALHSSHFLSGNLTFTTHVISCSHWDTRQKPMNPSTLLLPFTGPLIFNFSWCSSHKNILMSISHFTLPSPISYQLYKLLEFAELLRLYGLYARLAARGSAASQDGRERVGWCSNSSDSSNSSNSL